MSLIISVWLWLKKKQIEHLCFMLSISGMENSHMTSHIYVLR